MRVVLRQQKTIQACVVVGIIQTMLLQQNENGPEAKNLYVQILLIIQTIRQKIAKNKWILNIMHNRFGNHDQNFSDNIIAHLSHEEVNK